jgi:protocatechuate 3,4-dioxygenase beta subunit
MAIDCAFLMFTPPAIRRLSTMVGLWAACGMPAFAQQPLVGYIVPEYLAPQFTAAADAPSSAVIAGSTEPGPRLVVTGRTLFGDTPVAGVSLYVFQTDINGRYAIDVDNRAGELEPRLHGAMRSDAQGRYRFETIRPGSYDGFPSHVHYVVKADGYEPLLLVLQFADDPIAKQQAGRPPVDGGWAFENGPCKARPDCILTQPVTIDPQGVAHVVRDIQMIKK